MVLPVKNNKSFLGQCTDVAYSTIAKIISESKKMVDQPKTTGKPLGEKKSTPVLSSRNLNVKMPKPSKTEKFLDNATRSLTVLTTVSGTAATLLAPASIAGGLYSLGRAQNVKGRSAMHKAMAVDAAIDYLSLGNGERFQPVKNYPNWKEAAEGQKCYGQRAPLNSSFHYPSEKRNFIKHYKKTLRLIKKMQSTPGGRKELKDLVKKYKHFKLKNQQVSPHIYFIEN